MKIYDSAGWVNWSSILSEASGFLMVVGARGTGKTYGLLKELVKRKEPFIYLRRLKTQLDLWRSHRLMSPYYPPVQWW